MYLLCSIRLEYLLNFTGKLLNGWHVHMQTVFYQIVISWNIVG